MAEDFMQRMISGMKPEDKEKMVEKMMGKFFEDMKPEEKQKMMENMMSKMMGGKKESEHSSMPAMETQKDFKPWEFCPCRNLCQKGFEMGSKKGEK